MSFQKRMFKTSEFLALSRWGQFPVLVDGGGCTQSAAIVEHLAETLFGFRGAIWQHARLFGNGWTGMSMPCFRQSLTAMRFSLPSLHCLYT